MAEPEGIQGVYQRQARVWHEQRSRSLFEGGWLARLTDGLAPSAAILDLGCGSGAPMAAHLLGQGFAVTGVDFAAPMLAIACRELPGGTWIEADMRALSLGRRFDAILAWDSFFHLDPAAQRAMFPIFAAHLVPGGRLLLTTGPRAGEATGHVGGEAVYHASLAPDEYRALMARNELREIAFVPEDPECNGHSVWLIERPR